MSLMLTGLRTKQMLGLLNTVCKKCDQVETTKFYDDPTGTLPMGSFTKRCGCGTWIYRFHDVLIAPDPNNLTSYYTKAFVPSQSFDKNYCRKDMFERNGFKKMADGKYVR